MIPNCVDETTQVLLLRLPSSGVIWRVLLPFEVALPGATSPQVATMECRRGLFLLAGLPQLWRARHVVNSPPASRIRSVKVRSLSGEIVDSMDGAEESMFVYELVSRVCQSKAARSDEVRLMAGTTTLHTDKQLSEYVDALADGDTLEVSLAIVQGPPITVRAMSGREIELLEGVPEVDDECHFDRNYTFDSLGDFAGRRGMRYVMTSNDDRKTPTHHVMWQLDLRVPATVYVNFRSVRHVHEGRATQWLRRDGWEHCPEFRSTVSTGYPNGPYDGPVYAKVVHPKNRKELVDLMGSDFFEGTYFVFVEMDVCSD